jgi:nicotine blue oxidoreductase
MSPRSQAPIDGIVLAAGRSRRMGQPKTELKAEDGLTFLERAVRVLRMAGCRYVVAVINDEEDWSARLADVAGAAVVINYKPDSEQIDSLRLAIASLPDDSAGAVVLPVDLPAIHSETISTLVTAFRHGTHPVVVARCQDRLGHPVIFGAASYGELLADPLERGAETVVDAHAQDRLEVEVKDEGVLFDIDVPAEYERYQREH